jgi:outer membrane usher protein FimD/PapC
LRFGFGASTMLQDNTNTLILTPGISGPSQTTRQTQAHLSYQTSAHSAVTLTLTNQNQNTTQNGIETSGPTRTLQAGYSAAMGNTQLNFMLFRDTGSVATNAYSLSALIPLDFRRRAIVTAATQGSRDASNIVLTADPLLSGDHDDAGYSLTLGSSDSGLQVTDWTPSVDLQASYSRIADIDESQLEARGSIVSIGDRFYASRYILQSYGLAQVPDHPHVRVYADGQYVGSTDKQGDVLLPNLEPYQNNAVSLESKDFPVTANVDTFKKNAVPYYRNPVKVRFPVRSDGGVVVHIKMSDGSYLPSGATLSADDFSWPVLDQGSAYLEGVHPGSLTLSAEAGETQCLVSVTIPKNVTDIPDIGETVCRVNR